MRGPLCIWPPCSMNTGHSVWAELMSVTVCYQFDPLSLNSNVPAPNLVWNGTFRRQQMQKKKKDDKRGRQERRKQCKVAWKKRMHKEIPVEHLDAAAIPVHEREGTSLWLRNYGLVQECLDVVKGWGQPATAGQPEYTTSTCLLWTSLTGTGLTLWY